MPTQLKETHVARLQLPDSVLREHPKKVEDLLVAAANRMVRMSQDERYNFSWTAFSNLYCGIVGASSKTNGEMHSMQEQHLIAAQKKLADAGYGKRLRKLLPNLRQSLDEEEISDSCVVFRHFWNPELGIDVAKRVNALHRVTDLTEFFEAKVAQPTSDMSLNTLAIDMVQSALRLKARAAGRELVEDVFDSAEYHLQKNAFNFSSFLLKADVNRSKLSLAHAPLWFVKLGFERYAAEDLVMLVEAPNMDLPASARQKALENAQSRRFISPANHKQLTWDFVKVVVEKLSAENPVAVNDYLAVIGRARWVQHDKQEDQRIYKKLKRLEHSHAQAYLFGRFQTLRSKEIRDWIKEDSFEIDSDLVATLLRRGKHTTKILEDLEQDVTLDEVLALGQQDARPAAVHAAVRRLPPLDGLVMTESQARDLASLLVPAIRYTEPQLQELLKNPKMSLAVFQSQDQQKLLMRRKAYSFLDQIYKSGVACKLSPIARAAWKEAGADGIKVVNEAKDDVQAIQRAITQPIDGSRQLVVRLWNELCDLDLPLERRRKLLDNKTLLFAVKNGVSISSVAAEEASRSHRYVL